MHSFSLSSVKTRVTAAGWHLLISAFVALLVALLVLGLWYPGPFRRMAGGQDMLMLIVGVDVVLGPMLTLLVFNLAKGLRHLRRDLVTIGVLQLAAVAYGVHSAYAARPVALVFEVDRFHVVGAVDVYRPELAKARPEYQNLPIDGPRMLSLRKAKEGAEKTDALWMAIGKGYDMGQRPIFWVPYEEGRATAWDKGRPVQLLLQQYPARAEEFKAELAAAGVRLDQARFLPVTARSDWVAVLEDDGEICCFLPVNGFF